VLKVKFQNLGENQAEAHFKWEPKSGCFIPHESPVEDEDPMPWE
jgi:twinkle protein